MAERQRTTISPNLIWSRQNVITAVLATFIILSLLLHAYTIFSLLRVRRIVSTQLDVSADQVAQLRQQEVEYTFPVSRTFTIDTTVAVSETVDVPVNLTVPISETLTVPISTPVGSVELPVPINFTVPISDSITVPINKDIPFRTEVPISTTIPVELTLGEPPVGEVLQQLEEGLRDLRERLNDSTFLVD
jgi:hypothetical protein